MEIRACVETRRDWNCKRNTAAQAAPLAAMDLPSSPDFERTVKAAESGDAQAMLRAADYYYQGDLVKKNYKKAVQWYRRAAEQGLPKVRVVARIRCSVVPAAE